MLLKKKNTKIIGYKQEVERDSAHLNNFLRRQSNTRAFFPTGEQAPVMYKFVISVCGEKIIAQELVGRVNTPTNEANKAPSSIN